MTLAHKEALAMGLFAAFFLALLVLSIAYRRRTGKKSGWTGPAACGVVIGLAAMTFCLHGAVFGN